MNEKNIPWIILVGGVLVYSLGSGLLEKLGLKQSAEGKAIKNTLNSTNNAFSPNFWKPYFKGNVRVIDAATANNWAKIIYKAGVGWGTDENAIYGVLRGCKSKCDVSRVSEAFSVNYNKSFIDFLADEFTEAEMTQAIAIVNNLPTTRTT